MEKTGISFQEAADLISGGVGANRDQRNWDAIMASSDPAAAARAGLGQMYSGADNYSSGTYTKPTLAQQSGNVGIGNGPNQDIYLMDGNGNALTQIGSKGVLSNGSRAGGTFGMDISSDLSNLGLGSQVGKLGGVGKTLDGNWLDVEGAKRRFDEGNVGGQQNGQVGGSPSVGVGGMSAFSSPMLNEYKKNPYLDEMAGDITTQVNNNLQRNILPNIRAESIAAGGYGDTRNAITDALAVGETNRNLSGALSNLYGTDYNNQMNRNLQQYGIDNQTSLGWAANDLGWGNLGLGHKQADNSYKLGMGNLGLGYANLDRNISNDSNNWALQGANLLNNTWNQMNTNNAGALGAAGNIQNTALNYWQQFGNQANAFGQGYGTSTQSGGGGNPFMGALGGWQLGGQFGNMFGGSANAAGGANSQGWGTGAGFGNQDYGAYF